MNIFNKISLKMKNYNFVFIIYLIIFAHAHVTYLFANASVSKKNTDLKVDLKGKNKQISLDGVAHGDSLDENHLDNINHTTKTESDITNLRKFRFTEVFPIMFKATMV